MKKFSQLIGMMPFIGKATLNPFIFKFYQTRSHEAYSAVMKELNGLVSANRNIALLCFILLFLGNGFRWSFIANVILFFYGFVHTLCVVNQVYLKKRIKQDFENTANDFVPRKNISDILFSLNTVSDLLIMVCANLIPLVLALFAIIYKLRFFVSNFSLSIFNIFY
jgi:hypothetical protein